MANNLIFVIGSLYRVKARKIGNTYPNFMETVATLIPSSWVVFPIKKNKLMNNAPKISA